jgi:hypothetical protein
MSSNTQVYILYSISSRSIILVSIVFGQCGRGPAPCGEEGPIKRSGPQRTTRKRTKLLSWPPPIGGVYGFLQAFFYIERGPRSRMEIGERDTQVVHVNEATVA